MSRGIAGEEYGLTYKDLATGWVDCYPVKDKNIGSTIRALRSIPGPAEKLKYFNTDNAPELIGTIAAIECAHDTSIPGNHQNYTLIERTNRTIIEGTRAILFHAGRTKFGPTRLGITA